MKNKALFKSSASNLSWLQHNPNLSILRRLGKGQLGTLKLPHTQGLRKVLLFGVLYTTLPYFYTRCCFQDLNPWPFNHMTKTLPLAPRLPLYLSKKTIPLKYIVEFYTHFPLIFPLHPSNLNSSSGFRNLVSNIA